MVLIDNLKEFIKKKREFWESLCHKCGLCCYEKKRNIRDGVYIDLKSPCRFLDVHSKECTVYLDRLKVCKECRKVTIFHALFSPYMPSSCGYVTHYRKRISGKNVFNTAKPRT